MNREILDKLREAEKLAGSYDYHVDASGEVWSLTSNWRGYGARRLAQHPNSHGYLRVKIRDKFLLVHQLVARKFLGPKPSQKHQVCHIDGNKLNNIITNLRWGTAKDNAADRTKHGRCKARENGKIGAAKLRKTICFRGHAYDYINAKGGNVCRQCKKILNARRIRA